MEEKVVRSQKKGHPILLAIMVFIGVIAIAGGSHSTKSHSVGQISKTGSNAETRTATMDTVSRNTQQHAVEPVVTSTERPKIDWLKQYQDNGIEIKQVPADVLYQYSMAYDGDTIVTAFKVAEKSNKSLMGMTDNNDTSSYSIIAEFEDDAEIANIEENTSRHVIVVGIMNGTGDFHTVTMKDCHVVMIGIDPAEINVKRDAQIEYARNALYCTPLSDFYLNLNSDKTITLKALEVHSRECYIPSYYTVDGEKYTVRYINDTCFFGRSSLEIVSLPEGVRTIGRTAFNSCAVETLYLPSTLEDITGVFDYLHHVKTIYYAGTPAQWREMRGSGDRPDNVTVYCNTPVVKVKDKTNYDSATLITEKSQAEELGNSMGNAFNGFLLGLLGDEDDD